MTTHIRNVGELLADHLTDRGILVPDETSTESRRSPVEGGTHPITGRR